MIGETIMNSASVQDAYSKIESELMNENFFATVYSLDSHDQGMGCVYFIELKQRYPNSSEVKLAVLWKWWQRQLAKEGLHGLPEDGNDGEYLFNIFKELVPTWKFREISNSDRARVQNILNEMTEFIEDKKMLNEVTNKINTFNNGLVLDDDWNEFTLISSENSNMRLFNWNTDA